MVAVGEDRGTTALNGSLPPNPYRFHGQYLDSATGLYKMGLRYYSPKYARWTQQDVIETIGDPSEGNRYTYAGDDPVNNVDSSGAFWEEVGCAVGAVANAVNPVNQITNPFNVGDPNGTLIQGGIELAAAGSGITALAAATGVSALAATGVGLPFVAIGLFAVGVGVERSCS